MIDQGDRRLTLTVTVDNVPTDPATLTLTILRPGMTEAVTVTYPDATIIRESAGVFFYDLNLDEAGVWAYQWQTTDPTRLEGEHLWVNPAPVDDTRYWMPTLEQVAAILRARTRGIASIDASIASEQGTFTANTRPSADQVRELILVACDDLHALMGGRAPCTDELGRAAAAAAAYRAAMLVEISYYPEQTTGDQTAFTALARMWETAGQNVATSVAQRCPFTPGGDVDGGPLGRVPLRNLITWATRW